MSNFETLASVPIEKWRNGESVAEQDHVAEETPVALEYNGISHAVMLATPSDLEDFALGFSLTEGILADPSELYSCEISGDATGIRVEMQIASERFFALKEKRRSLAGRTGCGLCGTETLTQAIRIPPPVDSHAAFDVATLHAAFSQMEQQQHLQHRTGATHAAAWLAADGQVTLVREDVGRHNALDKLIGALRRQKIDTSTGAAIVTSRASYEMVQKAAAAGIGMLAAISAPTALAVRLAQTTGITLIGYVRQQSHAVYTYPQRLIMHK
ncbi:MAG: formate dehydrogenase accessory sulfurtransferase FdhD [Burkholderiaceae bacterium]|nr:formate dehydrogenase accessory sulfurtransferase FdhD [Burkholderiaceae bacterium]